MTTMPMDELRSSETSGDKEKPVNKTAMFVAAGVVCFVVGCLTLLSLKKADTGDFFTVIGTVVIPLLLALGVSKFQEFKAQNEQALQELKAQSDHIKHQTNGNTSQMMDMLRQLMLEKQNPQSPDKPDSA